MVIPFRKGWMSYEEILVKFNSSARKKNVSVENSLICKKKISVRYLKTFGEKVILPKTKMNKGDAFLKALRPDTSTFDKEEPLFIYDIKQGRYEQGGRIQYFLFCIGKQGHTVTLIVKNSPAILEAIIPSSSYNMHDVEKLCGKNRVQMEGVRDIRFVEKQGYNGFKFNGSSETSKFTVLEMSFDDAWDRRNIAKALEEEWDATIVGNDTPSELKFFMLTNAKPSSWVTCKRMQEKSMGITTDQLEFYVNYDAIIPQPENTQLPRFVVAGFDIETDNPEGFTKDGRYPVICISTHVYVDGGPAHTFTHYLENPYKIDEETKATYERQIQKQKSIPSTPITSKGTIYSFQSEYEMLMAWKTFLTDTINVDVITGYNIYGFDWLYICERIIQLGKQLKKTIPQRFKFEPQDQYQMKDSRGLIEFFSFSKIKKQFTGLICRESVSAAMGTNTLYSIPTLGRIHVDMIQKIKNHQTQKVVDTKLDTISRHFLNESKEDLKAPDLFKIWRLGYKDLIIAYCETDAALPVRLMYSNQLKIILEGIELSKLTITPLNQIINNGKTKFIKNMTIWYAREQNLVLNIDDLATKKAESGSYVGAKVLDPIPGKYDNVLVYDFNSLYPSIMQWGNLCSSTMIKNPKNPDLDLVQKFDITDPLTNTTVQSHYFVKKSVYEGLLPKMLNYLVTERKKNQRRMGEVKEEAARNNIDLAKTDYAVLNAAQLAKKLIANSVYGVCAYSEYLYGHKNVSETTTAMGRYFINLAKTFIETNYTHLGARCVYGDTDSVFIQVDLKGKNLLEILKIAEEIELACQNIFPKGITLGFEKIIQNLILSNVKKCYMGMIYEPNPKFDVPEVVLPEQLDSICERKFFKSITSAGFSTKKKGSAKIVTNLTKSIIAKLLDGISEDEVTEYVQNYINNIDVDYDLDDFIKINRVKNEYNGSPPYQKVVVEKLRHRKMDTPESGSFVPFVILTPESSSKLSSLYPKKHYLEYSSACGEDPEYLKELGKGNYDINFAKYLDMIKNDIERIFYVFPRHLYILNLTIQNKVILLQTRRTNTIFDIFGGRIEDYLPTVLKIRKKKPVPTPNGNLKTMFSSQKKRKSEIEAPTEKKQKLVK